MIFAKKIEQMYRARLFKRYDDTGCVFYFSPDDFPSLSAEPYTFRSKKGDLLKGYFYSYGEPIANRLIVFDHGMGAGHPRLHEGDRAAGKARLSRLFL